MSQRMKCHLRALPFGASSEFFWVKRSRLAAEAANEWIGK